MTFQQASTQPKNKLNAVLHLCC